MKRVGILVFCVLCCCMCTFMVACQKAGEEPAYSIIEPYQYPVIPGMEEWAEFESLQEKIDACQIPEDILTNLTTEALVETVVNYPLFINVFASGGFEENIQMGLNQVKGYFNGLQELYAREDAIEKMEIHIERLQNSEDDSTKYKIMFAEVVLEDLRLD